MMMTQAELQNNQLILCIIWPASHVIMKGQRGLSLRISVILMLFPAIGMSDSHSVTVMLAANNLSAKLTIIIDIYNILLELLAVFTWCVALASVGRHKCRASLASTSMFCSMLGTRSIE